MTPRTCLSSVPILKQETTLMCFESNVQPKGTNHMEPRTRLGVATCCRDNTGKDFVWDRQAISVALMTECDWPRVQTATSEKG